MTDPVNSAFAVLPPVPTWLEIGGERIELTPLKLGEVPAFAQALQTLAGCLAAAPDWLALLAAHGEALITAIAIATRRPRDWVAARELDEAVQLADAVFAVNADFFIRRLWPILLQAAARIGQVSGQVGHPQTRDGATPSSA